MTLLHFPSNKARPVCAETQGPASDLERLCERHPMAKRVYSAGRSLAERFFDGFNEESGPLNTPCWIWAKATAGPMRYGRVSIPGTSKAMYAHRASWEMHCGAIPEGLLVLHKCDRPRCVNPEHLFVGTQAVNITDCIQKGRWNAGDRFGERNPRAKLIAQDVQLIRLSSEHRQVLAAAHGVTPQLIDQIRSGKTWTRLPWPTQPGGSRSTS